MGRIFLPNPPPPSGKGRTKVGEGFSPLLPLPEGGGGLRWGRGIITIKPLPSWLAITIKLMPNIK